MSILSISFFVGIFRCELGCELRCECEYFIIIPNDNSIFVIALIMKEVFTAPFSRSIRWLSLILAALFRELSNWKGKKLSDKRVIASPAKKVSGKQNFYISIGQSFSDFFFLRFLALSWCFQWCQLSTLIKYLPMYLFDKNCRIWKKLKWLKRQLY